MGALTFAKAQAATFTFNSLPHKINGISLAIQQAVFDVTAAADTAKVLLNGIPVIGVSGQGSIYSGGYGKAQSSTLSLGTVVLHPAEWSVGKRFQLFDVTGSGDAEKQWEWGWPVVYGTVRGWVLSGGPLYETEDIALSAAFDVFGTVAGSVKVRNLRVASPFREGGPIPVSFTWQANGAVTHSGSLEPRVATATGTPNTGTLAFDLDSGETESHKALLYDFTVRSPAVTGGNLPITMNLRFDKAAA